MRPGVEGGTPSGSGPGPAEAQPGSLAPRDDTAAGGTPPTAEGGRDRLGASSGRWEWMGGEEARWADERGSSPSGEGPKPEEALCGVPPTRGDIAAHRPPPAGGMECGAPEGGRGGPEDADTGRSPVVEMRSEGGHLGDGERRRQGGGPGLGSAAGVVGDVHPAAAGGGGGEGPAAELSESATPSRASGAGGGALPSVASPTALVVDVGIAAGEAEEGERAEAVGLESGRRAPRTAGLRCFDFFDPIERNSWERRHALGDAGVVSLGHLAVSFGSFEEL